MTHEVCGAALPSAHSVRVGVERGLDVGVTETLGDDLGMHASTQKQGRVRVTKFVQVELVEIRMLRHGLSTRSRHCREN